MPKISRTSRKGSKRGLNRTKKINRRRISYSANGGGFLDNITDKLKLLSKKAKKLALNTTEKVKRLFSKKANSKIQPPEPNKNNQTIIQRENNASLSVNSNNSSPKTQNQQNKQNNGSSPKPQNQQNNNRSSEPQNKQNNNLTQKITENKKN